MKGQLKVISDTDFSRLANMKSGEEIRKKDFVPFPLHDFLKPLCSPTPPSNITQVPAMHSWTRRVT